MFGKRSDVGNYFGVYFALLVLLALTVEASRHDLGHWNLPVTLLIAVSKAVLIALVFMHVWRSPALLKLIVVASLGWLAILFSLTMADYSTRSWDLFKVRPTNASLLRH
jgi:cytochrome c oxidase subunit 4